MQKIGRGGLCKMKIFLNILKTACYVATFPLLLVWIAVIQFGIYEKVPYYTFWPLIGLIVTVVFSLIFLVVALVVTRKKSKSSIKKQTVKMLITVLALLAVFPMVLDTIVPDIVADATQGTMVYNDVVYDYDDQATQNEDLLEKFIRLNLLNGNFEGERSYNQILADKEWLSAYVRFTDVEEANMPKTATGIKYYEVTDTKLKKDAIDSTIAGYNPDQKKLFDTIMNEYLRFDYRYNRISLGSGYDTCVLTNQTLAIMITEALYPSYEQLIKDGIRDERVKSLFDQNYKSMDQDGYKTFDDCLLPYANSSRQTIPVLVSLILSPRDTRTDEEVGIVHKFKYFDEVTGEWVEKPVTWSILDIDGKPLSIKIEQSALDGLDLGGIDIGEILKGSVPFDNFTYDELFNIGIINTLADKNVANTELAAYLVFDYKVNPDFNAEQKYDSTNNPYYVGDGFSLVVRPMNVDRGVLGYQDMTWLQSNHLLFAVISLYSVRTVYFIVGAIAMVMIYIIGVLRQKLSEMKAAEAEAAAEVSDEIALDSAPAESVGEATEIADEQQVSDASPDETAAE